jgi:phospholipase/carboxylesterase
MLKDKKLVYKIIGEPENAEICLIFVHGWGGNKDSFQRVANSFNIEKSAWFLPQGPYVLEKKDNYSWTYEISPGKFKRDEPIKMLMEFFDHQIFSRFNSKDVFLFGFSQGGLVCYEMIKLLDKPLGGVFPIGGFMSEVNKNINRINPGQKDTPIFIGHGDEDEVISVEESRLAYKLLSKESSNVTLDVYKGGHKIGLGYIRKTKELIENKYK